MMQMKNADPADLQRLLIAARAAVLRLDADLFSLKQSLRRGDGNGGLKPFNRRHLSADDRSWCEELERKVSGLNSALVPFGFSLPNPAGL